MSEKIKIRCAKSDDVDLLYRWTNDEQVRIQSFTSDSISYESHCVWFLRKLSDESTVIFIVEVDSVPASVVRFEIENNSSIIGISIDEKFRGKGLGSVVISKGIQEYFKMNDLPILAYIKKDNTASIRAFEKSGFKCFNLTDINGVESVVYKLKKCDQ